MSPTFRKLTLTAHIGSSVGWLGAVAAFLALAVTGFTSGEPRVVEGTALAMNVTTWLVIVPFAITSLLSGVVVSLGTPWGLFRHYWVVVKLAVTVVATALLLLHTQPIGLLAAAARDGTPSSDVTRIQLQLIADAGGALLLLSINVLLSVFKPWGLIRARVPQQRDERPLPWVGPHDVRATARSASRAEASPPRWLLILGLHAIGVLLLFLVAHLTVGGALRH